MQSKLCSVVFVRNFLLSILFRRTNFNKNIRLKAGFLFRPCLINGGMPNGERFFRQSRQIFAGGLPPSKKVSRRVAEKYPPLGCFDIFQIRPKPASSPETWGSWRPYRPPENTPRRKGTSRTAAPAPRGRRPLRSRSPSGPGGAVPPAGPGR